MPDIVGVGDVGPGLTMPIQHIYLQLADPWTPVSDYTDITPLVEQWSGLVRGRQHELQLFQAGQVALTLFNNTDGRFNPWNTNSPYYNMLSPGDASCETSDGTFRTTPLVDNWVLGTTVNCSVFQSIPSVLIDGPVSHVVAIGANVTTTISSGDNTDTLATIVTAGKLLVATTAGFNASGFIAVQCNTGTTPPIAIAILQYTSVTGGATPSFNGISIIQGTTTWTVSTGGSVLQSTTASTVTMQDNVYPVVAGQKYSVMCSFLADSSVFPYGAGATCGINVAWYTATGSLISTTTSSTITDNQTTWTKVSNLGIQAPATAAYAAMQVTITGVAEERHYFSRVMFSNYSNTVSNTAWAPGQRGLVPGRPIYATATWGGVTYNVWSMYVSNFTPQYGQTKSEQLINCADGLALLALGDISSSAYATQVLTDGAESFWRLGDQPLSLIAYDSGPLAVNLTASQVSFGQASPLLTDDTTTALFTTAGGIPGSVNGVSPISSGAQTIELLFMMPPQTTAGVFFAAGNGSYVSFSSAGLSISGQITGSGTAASVVIVSPQIDNGQWHHLIITCSAATNGTMTVYLDGVNQNTLASSTVVIASGGGGSALLTTGTTFFFGSGTYVNGIQYTYNGNLADLAVYTSVLTTAQVANHYSLFSAGWAIQYSGQRIAEILTVIGWPSNMQNLATGISQVQAATSSLTQTSALSYCQTVEQTEMGAMFVDSSGNITFYDRHYNITATAATVSNGTFSDNPNSTGVYHYLPGLVPAMDDTDLWNDVPAQRNGGILQRSQSTLSIKQYTRRTLTGFTGELQTTDSEVLAQTQWLLSQYSIPYTRCRSISLSSRTDSGKNLQQMLGRSIFDLITLIWKPVDGSTVYFNQASQIESIQHTVTQAEWITTWGLTPYQNVPYMILNDPIKGQLSTNNELGY